MSSLLRRGVFLLWLASAAAFAAPWGDVVTDLPLDPALRQGTLPNGLRYAILPNAEPKDRVSLRLLVAAGSLHEADDERGLAHFVEHMAFRGTRTFPAGSLTAALQRLGMGIGPDSTAFTGYDHTIYHLELPDAKEATLHEGLRAFREYAGAVTFDAPAIEAERGVLLSEMATRNTPDDRTREANLQFLWPQSREARRKVIGEAAALRTFTREQFVAFYDAWYRPERIAVVIVGAVDPAVAERVVTEHFGSLVARGAARPEPELISSKAHGPDVQVFVDPGVIGVGITLQHPRLEPPAADTHAGRVRDLHEALAFSMFNARLGRRANQAEASFLSPFARMVPGLRRWQVATLSVAGRIDDWQRGAMDVELEHRRAFQFGFTKAELDEARRGFATSYEQSVRSAGTRPSSWLAQQLVAFLLQGGAFATPAEWQRDLAPALEAATLEDCLREFRAAWSQQAPSVFISAHPSFAITRQEIARVLNESRNLPVAAPAETTVPDFAYADFGAPGKIERTEHLSDLDVRLSRFANGVRFNFKSTTFAADTVEIHVRVGDGKLTQLQSQPGLDLLANAAFTAGGLGRHTAQELRDILSGHALQLQFQVDSDAFIFVARSARREVPLALKIVAAFLSDPGFRPEAMRETRARFNSMYASLAASPGGPITMAALPEIFDGDRRFGIPQFDELSGRHLGELTAWLEPQLKNGPVELSVVGDIAWEDASAAVAASLGALPARTERTGRFAGAPLRFSPSPKRGDQKIFLTVPTLQQVALAWFWPVPSAGPIHEERRCVLLASALQERLRIRLREELGATYAPSVGFARIDGFPGASYFSFYAEIQPARTKQALQIVDREVADVVKKGLTPDEFERAKQPYVRGRIDDLRTNIYWGSTVLSDAQQHPERISAARDRTADTAAITAAELHTLARKYLEPARAFRFATVPAPAAPSAPASTSTPPPAR